MPNFQEFGIFQMICPFAILPRQSFAQGEYSAFAKLNP